MEATVAQEWLSDPVGFAERGEHPAILAKMPSGFAVMGATQFLPGYCLLLASPRAGRLEELAYPLRAQFLADMGLLGEAISVACQPLRLNYSIYGNTDAYLHAHLVPRYEWEPAERRPRPVWDYPRENWRDPALAYDEALHGELKTRIGKALEDLLRDRG